MKKTSPVVDGLLSIHKIISRGLFISISKCDEYLTKNNIPQGDIDGFKLYVSTLARVIHGHHLSEDDIAFPYFKIKMEAPFDRLGKDHQEMAQVLNNLENCLSDLSLDGIQKLGEVLTSLNELWKPHIKIEEENFTVEKLNEVAKFEEQVEITKKLSSHSMKHAGHGPQTVPFLFYNLEGKDREEFMLNFPWIVKKVLVPVIWKGQWKPMLKFLG
jgi:hemerythrin superfamily protein